MFLRTIFVVTLCGLASAQVQPADPMKELAERCNVARNTDAVETAEAQARTSPELTAALKSWSRLWAFVQAPETAYIDRMAAAYQGASLARPGDLPALLTARRSPRESQACAFYRTALEAGAGVSVAAGGSGYLTAAERANAELPWQVQRAVGVLYDGVWQYYQDPSRHSDWMRSVEGLAGQGTTATLFTDVRDMDWLRRMVRLSLRNPSSAQPAATELDVDARMTPHFAELVRAAQLIVLQETKDPEVAAALAYKVGDVPSAREILAVGEWATRASVGQADRYAKFAYHLVKRLPTEFETEPNAKWHPSRLAEFEKWFVANKARLEREAAADRGHWQALVDEIYPYETPGRETHYVLAK